MERNHSIRRVVKGNDDERLTHSESGEISRKRSMIKPERQRLNRDNPQYYYTLASEESNLQVLPSSTGNDPHLITSNSQQQINDQLEDPQFEGQRMNSSGSLQSFKKRLLMKTMVSSPLRREQSQYSHLEREESVVQYTSEPAEPVLDPQAADTAPDITVESQLQPEIEYDEENKPILKPMMSKERNFDPWLVYCKLITFPIVPVILRWFGLKTPERQMAWREKIGLITCILYCGCAVGFLTFGFTQTVCSSQSMRVPYSDISSNFLIVAGKVFDLGDYNHPQVLGIQENSPVLYPPINAGGTDASFLFQNVNGNCQDLIKPRENATVPFNSKNQMGWYFPCELMHYQNGSLINNSDLVNESAKNQLYQGWGCHTQQAARQTLFAKKPSATLYFTWDELSQDENKHLICYNGDVLDLTRLDHLLNDQLTYPEMFDTLRNDAVLMGHDISQDFAYGQSRKVLNCLREITKVGEIDSEPIGCIASKVVLYISLVFIMGLVVVKFLVACYFRFFIARHQGAFPISETEFHNRERKIEDWGDDIYSPANRYRPIEGHIAPSTPDLSNNNDSQRNLGTPQTKSSIFSWYPPVGAQTAHPQTSMRSSQGSQINLSTTTSNKRKSLFLERLKNNPNETSHISGITMSTQNPELTSSRVNSGQSLQQYPVHRQSMVYEEPHSATHMFDEDISYRGMEPEYINMEDLPHPPHLGGGAPISRSNTPYSFVSEGTSMPSGPVGGADEYIVSQPPLEFQPFGYPLAHVMCMVTAYSESVEGLRTTLDSICTTDYPNSHKLVTIVCDGLIKGSGNDLTTPEICLSMMKDFSEPVESQEPHSYVSVVSGEKRHNMAKVYAGFYKYDDSTVPVEKQQRVPVICIVKCGTPKEVHAAKPGNRGKRDSQVILMSFLQHIMFDERMTELDFQIFNGIRSVTGIAPDYYEMMLMVDADTKVYPDCLTHMVAEMVKDPEVMGLCGETKIANKRQSWVTMIQVFEYFISHHQAKGFESVFGSVSCLPGCFSMYRIKSPKGADGYWVPILCNPDIVERYSDNVIDTLHRKNLLLLGEDRYLSTLMAKTFPKRKTIFVPKAACKTIVPDEFKVLLSQRRRWINSTIHNLFELVLVRNSCGVFVISMQFVVFIDLVSTLVLPAAIAFTIYVIVIAIVKKPTPTLSLILLAMILGLPGLLIVVTATRASYLVWMFIYILALPIWNFVLPMYAYWKFDDFSWGDTRAIVGGDKGHEEANGEFDSSQIKMKRWKEFQQDRQRGESMQMNSDMSTSSPYQTSHFS